VPLRATWGSPTPTFLVENRLPLWVVNGKQIFFLYIGVVERGEEKNQSSPFLLWKAQNFPG